MPRNAFYPQSGRVKEECRDDVTGALVGDGIQDDDAETKPLRYSDA